MNIMNSWTTYSSPSQFRTMPSVSPRSFSVDFIAAVAKRLLLSRLNCRCGFLFLGQVPALARIIQRPGRKIVEWGVSLIFLNLDSDSNDRSHEGRAQVSQKKSHLLGRVCFLITTALLVINIGFTALSLKASMANHPDGNALLATRITATLGEFPSTWWA